jgi:hypothetical protein
MKDLYTKKYLTLLLQTLRSDIMELMNWSAYNDDQLNEEIAKLGLQVQEIEELSNNLKK